MKPRRNPRLRLWPLEERIAPALYVVTSTSNANTVSSGSLRRAITDANASPGLDTIQFNIPGAGVQNIQVNNTLAITEAVIIDGWSQPGFTTTPLIELSAKGGQAQGVTVAGGGTTLQGLILNGFSTDAIYLDGGSNNLVRGCWIGTNDTGLLDDGNGFGISVRNSASTTIGGTTSKDRNVISGSDFDNIRIWGPNADGTRVIGNYIGTDITGQAPIGGKAGGGGIHGIWLGDTSPTADIGSPDHITIGGLNAGERNVIGGMSLAGVINTLASQDNLIQGNYIGVSADGKVLVSNRYGVIVDESASKVTINRNVMAGTALLGVNNNFSQAIVLGGTTGPSQDNIITGNTIGLTPGGLSLLGQFDHGVVVFDAKNNRIGGTTAADRNIIAGSAFEHVGLYGDNTFGNLVQGNYLGTDATGAKLLGTGSYRGIWVGDNYPPSAGSANNNTIGGTVAGAGNVIGGSVAGVLLTLGANLNTVQGNFVGTDSTGTANLANQYGFIVEINATNNTIGGTAAGAGNVIANSTQDGLLVGYATFSGSQIPAGPGNRISGNSIRNNGALAIDLGFDDGVTANDALDADTGANLMQNYPVIVSAKSGATTLVSGVLKSAANSTYTIEFFANSSVDPSGFGEGSRYLGSATVTTDATGRAEFIDKSMTSATVGGEFITATATDAAGNTSEFSNGILVDILPKVTSLVVNNGVTQRSRVTALSVTFNQFVTLPTIPANAFDLRRQIDSAVVTVSATKSNDLFTTVTMTFTGGAVESVGSLADGRYTLTASAALIGNANGALDGNNDGIDGGTYVHVGAPSTSPGLYRLFGDSTGDGTVNQSDYNAFRTAFLNGPSTVFDFDGDGNVNQLDYNQFRLRYLIPI